MAFLFKQKGKSSKPTTIPDVTSNGEYFKACGAAMTLVDKVTVQGSRSRGYTAFGAKIIPSDNVKTYIWTAVIED